MAEIELAGFNHSSPAPVAPRIRLLDKRVTSFVISRPLVWGSRRGFLSYPDVRHSCFPALQVPACFFPLQHFPRLFASMAAAVAPLCLLLALSRAYALPVAGSDHGPDTEDMSAMSLTIASPAFDHGESIPARFTCEGKDVSPALAWDGVPDG